MSYLITPATVGGPITAGMYNQLTNLLINAPIARVTKSAAQSTSGTIGANTAVGWDTETYDPQVLHDNVTNNTRITIPVGWGGYYSVKSSLRYNTASATVTTQFAVNGVVKADTAISTMGVSGPGATSLIATDIFLNDSDYLEVFIQANAASVPLIVSACSLSVAFIHI